MPGPEDLSHFRLDENYTPPPPKAVSPVVEFNGIVKPLIFLENPERTSAVMRTLPRSDAGLHAGCIGAMRVGEEHVFAPLIKRGRYPELLTRAQKLSQELMNDHEVTIPRAFATHALMSVYANVFRPPAEEVLHTDDRTTYFLTQFAAALAMQVPKDVLSKGPDPYDFQKQISGKTASLLSAAICEDPEWLLAKYRILADRLLLRQHTISQVEKEPVAKIADVKTLRRHNNELFQELRRLKYFSIKSAVHEAGDSHWSIHDVFNAQAEVATQVEERNSDIRPDLWPLMAMTVIEHPDMDGYMITPAHNFDLNIRPGYDQFRKFIHMDHKGELFADPHGAMPYWEFYKAAGKPGNYEVLRQFLIRKYFDLTVRIEMVEEAESETDKLLRSPRWEGREPDVIVHDLLLPRILRLRKVKNAAELQEYEEAELSNGDESGSKIRQRAHDRAVQKRRLPAGYKPSAQALELAERHGIILGVGETCVKAHTRGDASLGWVISRVRSPKDC
ncbi:MAG TPA: hypothetical protein VF733_06905 [Candidatus Saccharimonadales bacterium]